MFQDKVFQVSEFNELISTYLKQVGEIVVEGEISEINVSQGKWLFVTLKDETANLSIFAPVFTISGWQALEAGMKVQVTGVPGLSQKYGKFSLNAKSIIPSGEGALRLAFEKLKHQLEREGLFDSARKRSLPMFPKKIGLITAKNSEAYNDFIKVLRERIGGVKIYFVPVNVQGKDSVSSILSAFRYFNTQVPELDALILARGGGSLADLISFNDEQVVRAVFASKFPVVVGVGHERDISLCDLVADVRASTPSNAAELISKHRREFLEQIQYSVSKMSTVQIQQINQKRHQIDLSKHILTTSLHAQIQSAHNQLRLCLSGLERGVNYPLNQLRQIFTRFSSCRFTYQNQATTFKSKVVDMDTRIISSVDRLIDQERTSINQIVRMLDSFDHQKTLSRGYALVSGPSGKLLRSIHEVSPNSHLQIDIQDGRISTTVNSVSATK